jgi:hypothetical protein
LNIPFRIISKNYKQFENRLGILLELLEMRCPRQSSPGSFGHQPTDVQIIFGSPLSESVNRAPWESGKKWTNIKFRRETARHFSECPHAHFELR